MNSRHIEKGKKKMRAPTTWLTVIALAAVTSTSSLSAETYMLVSPEEYTHSIESDAEDEEFFERAADPLAPKIEMTKPGDQSDIQAPIDIEVVFLPEDGATIDLETLKITYGAFRVNVTERVTENASVTKGGIVSEGAELPAGKHKLTISIDDSLGRRGKSTFKFRVIQ